ncbi:MAG TPA: hypothetical protein VMV78_07025 [Thiobacillus sp.]|nr:hypothetical protein [Thiobacillus sp.]
MASRLGTAFLKSLRTLLPAGSLPTAPGDTRPFESRHPDVAAILNAAQTR